MSNKSTALHLLEFTIENYRSIRNPVTLSFFATPLHDRSASFSIKHSKRKALSSIAIYGANASGKSNIMRALFVFRNALIGANSLFNGSEEVDPFLLDELSKTKASTFEASFEYENKLYIYGFQVSSRRKIVLKEWLRATRSDTNRMVVIYERDGDAIEVSKSVPLSEHGISRSFSRQLQPQELFLTTLSRNSAWTMAKSIVSAWESCHVLNTLVHDPLQAVADEIYQNPKTKDKILPLLQLADLSITDIKVEKDNADEYNIKLEHTYATKSNQKTAWFDIRDQESAGTGKFFSFVLPLLLSLNDGTLIALDELGSTFHPDLLRFIVELFNSPQKNPYHAQLLLTTHDTSLLKDLFARDQIYFTSKLADQSTDLYSLGDVKGVRKDIRNLDERYLQGDYGAVPYIIQD